jgi:hypothetical protein
MATGDIITATRYNQIQATVSSVLGVGSGDSGYGQQLQSTQVAATQIITAVHMNRLRNDMLSTFIHQTGSNSGFTLPLLEAGTDLVSDAPSSVGNNEYESYPLLATTLLSNRNNYPNFNTLPPPTSIVNYTPEFNRTISSRNTPWGGAGQAQSVFHEVRIQFETANDRRYFFNTGSQIRIEASLTNFPGGGGQGKFTNWSSMLSGMGRVIFKSFETTNTGISGTPLAIGNYSLTSNYQIIFTKGGSGLYSNNSYVIKARQEDSRTILFLIEFNDLDTGSGTPFGTDEPVEGLLTSRVGQFRATGTTIGSVTKVIAPSPFYQNIRTL